MKTPAQIAAERIMTDLRDRQGIGDEIDQCSPNVQANMRDGFSTIIEQAYMERERERITTLRDALKFIAGQGCEGDVGDAGQCKDLPDDVTDYCVPCYAAAALEADVEKQAAITRATSGRGGE